MRTMSDTKRQSPEDSGPEEIWETTKKIEKLETNSVIGNPGFPLINQNILFFLDHKSQMAFRQTCFCQTSRMSHFGELPDVVLPKIALKTPKSPVK